MATTTRYTFSQLEQLWIQAGGNKAYAPMAAAVAMAESSGNPNSTNVNHNGTVDRGLWQINSIHGSQSVYDPLANAKSAVAISHNGTNWRPWCSTWSHNDCSGTFMGAGAHVLKYLPAGSDKPDTTTNTGAQTTGQLANALDNRTNGPAATQPIGVDFGSSFWDWVTKGFGLNKLAAWLGYFLLMLLGLVLMAVGVVLLITSTRTVKRGGRAIFSELIGTTASTKARIRVERREGLIPERQPKAVEPAPVSAPPAPPPPKPKVKRETDTAAHRARGKGAPLSKTMKDFKGTGGAHRGEP